MKNSDTARTTNYLQIVANAERTNVFNHTRQFLLNDELLENIEQAGQQGDNWDSYEQWGKGYRQ